MGIYLFVSSRLDDQTETDEIVPTNIPQLLLRALYPDGFVWSHGWKVIGAVLYFISSVCLALFVAEEVKEMRSLGATYFKNFWNFADVGLIVGLFLTTFLLCVPTLSDLEVIHPLASVSMMLVVGRLLQVRTKIITWQRNLKQHLLHKTTTHTPLEHHTSLHSTTTPPSPV